MAQLNTESTFTSWILTDEELEQASMLSDLQTKHIQNFLCNYAEQKSNLTFTEENKQREAELAGAIIVFRQLLDLSKAAYARQQERLVPTSSGIQEGDPSGHSIFQTI